MMTLFWKLILVAQPDRALLVSGTVLDLLLPTYFTQSIVGDKQLDSKPEAIKFENLGVQSCLYR
jgi:hypothetical protein